MILGASFDDPPAAGLNTGICSVRELSASSETEAQSRRKVPTRETWLCCDKSGLSLYMCSSGRGPRQAPQEESPGLLCTVLCTD